MKYKRTSGVGDVPETLLDLILSKMWFVGKEGCKDAFTLASNEALSGAERGLYEALQARTCTPVTNVESSSRPGGIFPEGSTSH